MRVAVLALVVAIAMTSAPGATGGDARRAIVPADQARAASIVVDKADLATGFVRAKSVTEHGFDCAALDESDLVITGEARRLYVLRRRDLYVTVGSWAVLYADPHQSALSWRRASSAAGLACFRRETARDLARDGLRIVSMTRQHVERPAPRTLALRLVLAPKGSAARFYYDIVLLSRGRAQAAVGVMAAGTPVPDRDRAGFSRLVAGRIAKALGAASGPTA
ncbi:MAG TPA: hypothetical protein VJ689_01125 [Gaiellaceae bacterium]|jgi:hypothetical protein|nr:hypothetical protein [Gaiellaceae bacterium]